MTTLLCFVLVSSKVVNEFFHFGPSHNFFFFQFTRLRSEKVCFLLSKYSLAFEDLETSRSVETIF